LVSETGRHGEVCDLAVGRAARKQPVRIVANTREDNGASKLADCHTIRSDMLFHDMRSEESSTFTAFVKAGVGFPVDIGAAASRNTTAV